MKKQILIVLATAISLALIGCPAEKDQKSKSAALFTEEGFSKHLEVLASDDMEGRGIGSPGGEKAANYIAGQFEKIGLEPISEEAGYFQYVPIRAATTIQNSVEFSVQKDGESVSFEPVTDVLANSELESQEVSLDGELYFIGYGIEAPEYGWDDYKGMDIAGKIVVMLVNDPDLEKTGFGSEEMSYYGRWTYKQEICRQKGAKGLILIHTDETATYPFSVVQSSWGKEQIRIDKPLAGALELSAWVSQPSFDKALAFVGTNFTELKEKADSKDFKPFSLGLQLKASLRQATRTFRSPNVIGKITGAGSPDEVVTYTAHYDHLGIGRPVDGDNIYNGAKDNASGVSALINIAKAYKSMPSAPARTVMFMSVTAEEGGLLGSKYYVQNPLYPLEDTAVVINMDSINVFGESDDFHVMPIEATNCGPIVADIGKKMGMELVADPFPGRGSEFRSDHFPFCAKGVVALSVGHGSKFRGKPEGWGKETVENYTRNNYHQPSDEIQDWWDLKGAVQYMHLCYNIGMYWADSEEAPPKLSENNPFVPAIRMWNSK